MVAASARLVFGRAGLAFVPRRRLSRGRRRVHGPRDRPVHVHEGWTDRRRGPRRGSHSRTRCGPTAIRVFRRSGRRETIGSWDRSAWRSLSSIKAAEAYYWVAASDRRRGVASASLGLLADWAFERGIERLYLLVHPENEASSIALPHDAASPRGGLTGLRTRQRGDAQTSCRGHYFRATRGHGTLRSCGCRQPSYATRTHRHPRAGPPSPGPGVMRYQIPWFGDAASCAGASGSRADRPQHRDDLIAGEMRHGFEGVRVRADRAVSTARGAS